MVIPPLQFLIDYFHFKQAETPKRFKGGVGNFYPCLLDRTLKTGFDRHYVYHTAWAARALARLRPNRHVDIGSHLYFAAIVSAYLPIDFYDYRPVELALEGLTCSHADITHLPFADNSIPSLSCMHVVEHIGLGRYGDPVDPQGDLKAISELQRVVSPGGDILFVVPVGHEAILRFNAHRVYTIEQVKQYFHEWDLRELYFIPDTASVNPTLDPSPEMIMANSYACGCFWFRKKGHV